jgi:hypothetical protein
MKRAVARHQEGRCLMDEQGPRKSEGRECESRQSNWKHGYDSASNIHVMPITVSAVGNRRACRLANAALMKVS